MIRKSKKRKKLLKTYFYNNKFQYFRKLRTFKLIFIFPFAFYKIKNSLVCRRRKKIIFNKNYLKNNNKK